jgi:hypothetical protein
MGSTVCPETSVSNYQCTLRKVRGGRIFNCISSYMFPTPTKRWKDLTYLVPSKFLDGQISKQTTCTKYHRYAQQRSKHGQTNKNTKRLFAQHIWMWMTYRATNIPMRATKSHGEDKLQSFLKSTVDGGRWSNSGSPPPGKRAPNTLWPGSCTWSTVPSNQPKSTWQSVYIKWTVETLPNAVFGWHKTVAFLTGYWRPLWSSLWWSINSSSVTSLRSPLQVSLQSFFWPSSNQYTQLYLCI